MSLDRKGRKMQIKKTYTDINPELLYDEVRDLAQKYGVTLVAPKLQTYSVAGASSQHISRGTLIFKMPDEQDKSGKECLRVHIVGSFVGDTKMVLDADEKLFPPEKISALEEDLNFIFGSYERT
jgi:hypothetical protein